MDSKLSSAASVDIAAPTEKSVFFDCGNGSMSRSDRNAKLVEFRGRITDTHAVRGAS